MTDYLDLRSGPVFRRDYGGEGAPIVLVHGLGGSIANWDTIGPRLSRHGHVVALDLPGFGLSPPAVDWELDTHVDVIAEFVERFEPPATLIGNSMGGLLAEMVAANRPELVSALVLVSPATPPRLPDPRIHWPMARRLLLNSAPGIGPALSRHVMRTLTPEQLIHESLARITHKPGRVPIDVVETLVALARTRSYLPWAADAVPRTGASIRRLFLKRSRFVAMIRRIKAPTIVIQGVADPIVSPTAVEWMCSLRPDWALVQMEDTGHTPHIDAPVRFLAVLEPWLETWLKRDSRV